MVDQYQEIILKWDEDLEETIADALNLMAAEFTDWDLVTIFSIYTQTDEVTDFTHWARILIKQKNDQRPIAFVEEKTDLSQLPEDEEV